MIQGRRAPQGVQMIRVALDFPLTMLRFPAGCLVWIAALILVNGVVPIVFLPATEAVVTLAFFMLAVMLQMAVFGRHGFVRLLGIVRNFDTSRIKMSLFAHERTQWRVHFMSHSCQCPQR